MIYPLSHLTSPKTAIPHITAPSVVSFCPLSHHCGVVVKLHHYLHLHSLITGEVNIPVFIPFLLFELMSHFRFLVLWTDILNRRNNDLTTASFPLPFLLGFFCWLVLPFSACLLCKGMLIPLFINLRLYIVISHKHG